MLLHLQRQRRNTFFASPRYILHIRAEASPWELDLIQSHHLARQHLFTSREAQAFAQLSGRAFDEAQDAARFKLFQSIEEDWKDIGRSLTRSFTGLHLAYRASRAPRLTIQDALDGTSFQTADMAELIELEAALTENISDLDRYLTHLARFDDGNEHLIEPEPLEPGTPPNAWPRYNK